MNHVWLAGYFDARGSIHAQAEIRKSKKTGRMTRNDRFWVQVNGASEFLEVLAGSYGGNVSSSSRRRGQTHSYWRRSGGDAVRFLRDILPHSVLRRAEIEAGLLFAQTVRRAGGGSAAVPHDVQERRTQLAGVVSKLRPRRQLYGERRQILREAREELARLETTT